MTSNILAAELVQLAKLAPRCRDVSDQAHIETCRAIVRLVKCDVPKQVVEDTLFDPAVREARPHLQQMMARMEIAQEEACAKDLLARFELSFESLLKEPRLFSEWYIDLVARECELLGESLDRPTVFVGAGAIPLSPLLYLRNIRSRQIHHPLVGLECDESFSRFSSALLHRLGNDGVEIIHTDGCIADYSEFGNVVIASLAEPLDRILVRIRNFPNVAQVVVRGATGLATLIYREVSESVVNRCGFRMVANAVSESAMNGSYLLRPR